MLIRVCSVLFLSLLALSTCILAKDLWIEVGSANARVSGNTLTIVPKTEELFDKLRFQITRGHIILSRARVYLVKGDVFNVNLQKSIKDGQNSASGQNVSRMIPLTMSQQSPIKKVIVFYTFKQQQTSSTPVTVELLGTPVPSRIDGF